MVFIISWITIPGRPPSKILDQAQLKGMIMLSIITTTTPCSFQLARHLKVLLYRVLIASVFFLPYCAVRKVPMAFPSLTSAHSAGSYLNSAICVRVMPYHHTSRSLSTGRRSLKIRTIRLCACPPTSSAGGCTSFSAARRVLITEEWQGKIIIN